ncbi:NAD(P)-dependent alcohol dehydrogenase [Streptomyces sp. NBC_01275]|uniref:NAD(P)-dependent alcohol dehydrogenase n=1 Tax=Streptomyces sp. NBC_01275 TaxID=2903807 RepID=UPI002259E2B4|nr:NAD(P)-dependent alcohol dehydrogenase [Streptomyces sp. NBC_01275]MCX4766563.1 NAD(P)-dependent alcohol dehydrogenase [Streptomyces sp. NBC_01275]
MPRATAAVVRARGHDFGLEEIDVDEPRAHEVLVRVRAAGICHTDLSVRAGHTPFPVPAVLGHEGTGTVEAVGGAVTSVAPGDTVVLSFASCGDCPACLTGRPVRCAHWPALNLFGGSRLDGSPTVRGAGRHARAALHGHFFGQSSFATLALTAERDVVPVPAGLPPQVLAPLGCGVQTGVGAVLNVLRPEAGHTLAVYGTGSVGLAAVMAARLTPATRVIAVDPDPKRLALARRLGATDAVNPREDDALDAVRELTGGRGAERALETSGAPRVLRQAVDGLAVSGVCGVVGAPPAGTEAAFDVPSMLDRGPRVVGVNQGEAVPRVFVPALVELYRAGRLPFDEIVSVFPFARIEEAAGAAARGDVVKPVLMLA